MSDKKIGKNIFFKMLKISIQIVNFIFCDINSTESTLIVSRKYSVEIGQSKSCTKLYPINVERS